MHTSGVIVVPEETRKINVPYFGGQKAFSLKAPW